MHKQTRPYHAISEWITISKKNAEICDIHEKLSTHIARHSYATSISLTNGVSMENLAKILGHTDTSITRTLCTGAGPKYYGRYTESK